MKNRPIFIFSVLIVAVCSRTINSQAAIMSSEVRAEKLTSIRSSIETEVKPLEQKLIEVASSPFVPDLGRLRPPQIEAPRVFTSEEEFLAVLSENIKPTGIFSFGGEFYLVFKEEKLKVGSDRVISLNGEDYKVTIEEITGSEFKVRFGESVIQLKLK